MMEHVEMDEDFFREVHRTWSDVRTSSTLLSVPSVGIRDVVSSLRD